MEALGGQVREAGALEGVFTFRPQQVSEARVHCSRVGTTTRNGGCYCPLTIVWQPGSQRPCILRSQKNIRPKLAEKGGELLYDFSLSKSMKFMRKLKRRDGGTKRSRNQERKAKQCDKRI